MGIFNSYRILYIYAIVCLFLSLSLNGPDELAQYRIIMSLTTSLDDSSVFFSISSFLLLIQKSFITLFITFFEIFGFNYLPFIKADLINNYLYLPLSGESVAFHSTLFNINQVLLKLPQFLVILYIIHICVKKNYVEVIFCFCIPSTIPILLNITTDYLSYIISIFFIQLCNTSYAFIKILVLVFLTLYLDNNFFPILFTYLLYITTRVFNFRFTFLNFIILGISVILLIRLHILLDLNNFISNTFNVYHYSYEESLAKYFRQILILIMSFWYLDGPMSYMAFGPEYVLLPIYLYFTIKYADNNSKNIICSSLITIIFLFTSVIVFSHSRFYLFLMPSLYFGYKYSIIKFNLSDYMYLFPILGIIYKLSSFIILFYTLYIY